jgi:hypothetical protein
MTGLARFEVINGQGRKVAHYVPIEMDVHIDGQSRRVGGFDLWIKLNGVEQRLHASLPGSAMLTEQEKCDAVMLLQKGAVDYFHEGDIEVHIAGLPSIPEWEAALAALLEHFEIRRRE